MQKANWLLVMLTTACAGQRGIQRQPPTPAVGYVELQRYSGMSAYQVVERLLPHVLRARPGTYARGSFEALPQVYSGGQWVGDVTFLHDLWATQLLAIRYLPPIEALQRYGRESPRGVIEVDIKR